MKYFSKTIVVVTLLLIGAMQVFSQTPAFPGAEGGGKLATGGRGGAVYFVNTLEDNNVGNAATREGSLRWCLGQSATRTIVFRVGGIVKLKSRLNITKGNVTIAGQTAPGDGICIKDYEVVVDADNVIMRYMRFRLGDEITTHEPDALWGRYKKNNIIDHCSMSWSIDECASFYSNENFTMQWCIIAESLNSSIHGKGLHGYGGIWGGKNASFHHNLLAHHNSRNPRFNGWKREGLDYSNPLDEERLDFRNNVIYNWGSNSVYGGESAGKYNMVANYYKAGPASSNRSRVLQVSIDKGTNITPRFGKFYIEGNYMAAYPGVTADNWTGVSYDSGVDKVACKASVAFETTPILQHTAEKAFEKVLAFSGASLSRDAVDARITTEAANGTATYSGSVTGKKGLIDTQTDVGGWPVYKSGTPPSDSNADGIPDGWLETNYPGKIATQLNEEGYTYLEVYLNSIVADITFNQYQDAISTGVDDVSSNVEDIQLNFKNSGNVLFVKSLSNIDRLSVFNVSGELLLNQRVNSAEIVLNTSELSRGVYIVKVLLPNNRSVASKVMK